ncbi:MULTISPECIES: FadR/GntR family transcriptional regulator [Cohnella]|uniref:FadR/GntR family transcriptional regulator n=1 Tax=Cohnella TaxID=329857 RepID=UPI0009B9D1FF|nr:MULTISPECIES: FadR/GntR family transcriptional regulator [Cohnella]MBN2979942.1 FadR family transcriptional regulator [Cohnella algarum]
MNENRPLKSHEWVMNDLRKQLEEGALSPGDRLASVVELAERYGVGRSTVREALSALKAMGMLDIRQGGGTFVKATLPAAAPPHPGMLQPEAWADRALTLRHILEVRRVLETGCAALAAASRSADDLARLAGTLAEMEAHMDDEAFNEQADVRFHEQIAAATHNPLLMQLMETMAARLHDSMRDTRALWFYAERSTAERLLEEHRAIYEAIAEGDAGAATLRMQLHIAKVEQVLGEKGAGA